MSVKEQLQTEVKEWLHLDEQLTKLKKAIKERKNRKKELDIFILELMKQNEITHMNINDGKLVYSKSRNYKSLSKNHMAQKISEYLEDPEKGRELCEMIMKSRDVVEKINLKRRFNRKKTKGIDLSD